MYPLKADVYSFKTSSISILYALFFDCTNFYKIHIFHAQLLNNCISQFIKTASRFNYSEFSSINSIKTAMTSKSRKQCHNLEKHIKAERWVFLKHSAAYKLSSPSLLLVCAFLNNMLFFVSESCIIRKSKFVSFFNDNYFLFLRNFKTKL